MLTWWVSRSSSAAVRRSGPKVSVQSSNGKLLVIRVDPLDGWRDQAWFYIRPECWKAIHDEGDPIEMARLHGEGGLLKTQGGTGLQFRMGRGISERPRVYAVRASALLASAEA